MTGSCGGKACIDAIILSASGLEEEFITLALAAREMKDLEKRIAARARAHVKILKARRGETDLTEPKAQLIIKRIDNVLDKLPAAVKQAHERIIGGRSVSNED